jgi:hypothetical protein
VKAYLTVKAMAKYFRTMINDITAPEIIAMCDDLLASKPYPPNEQYDLQLWKWFGWFFHENKASKLTISHFPPHSALVTKLEKLSQTAIFELCQEIAAERNVVFEGYLKMNLLTFLKKVIPR